MTVVRNRPAPAGATEKEGVTMPQDEDADCIAVSYKNIEPPTFQTLERIYAERVGNTEASKVFEAVLSSRYAELRWGNPIPLPSWVHDVVTWAQQQRQ
jgi:hypothetical protein